MNECIQTVEVDGLVADGGLRHAGDTHLIRVDHLDGEWTSTDVHVRVPHCHHVLACTHITPQTLYLQRLDTGGE